MSGDGVTVAEIVEHAYKCGSVKVTNYREFEGDVTETWGMVDGEPLITGTEYVTNAAQVDDIRASFPNATRVSIKLRVGLVGPMRVAPGPGEYFSDARRNWPDRADWREVLAAAGAMA